MMKQLLVFLLTLFAVEQLAAQQLPLFTQYRENHSVINPAILNSDFHVYEYNLSAGVSYRTQWTGLQGLTGPQTLTGRFEWIFPDNHAYWGAYIINDRIGPTSMTGGYVRGGYIISPDPSYAGLVFGLSAGYVQHRIKLTEEAQNLFPEVSQGSLTTSIPDFGFGVYYYQSLGGRGFSGDVFYAGLSSPQTFGLDLTYKELGEEASFRRIQHFYGVLGYYKFLNEDSFLEPSMWVRYVPGAPVSVDLNLRFQLSQNLWIGTGGSSNGTAHMEFGVLIGENVGFYDNNFKIGYGIDMPFNKEYGGRFKNSHEINITYTLDTGGFRR